jgi:hypothetical protein
MQYVTRRSHQMQKHRFEVACPNTLFMETDVGPPEHEKQCVDVSHPGRTGMNYVNRRSQRI